MATFIHKKVRKTLDDMISFVCSAGAEGERVTAMEMGVVFEDGEEDSVTILVIRGEWYDYLLERQLDRFEIGDYIPQGWEEESHD